MERRLVEAHERVSAERPVLVLSDLDPIVVRGAVADSVLPRLEIGMLGFMAPLGMIALTGIVVNDSIVLVTT